MTRLDDFASNDAHTVDGEAGLINHIFEQIGIRSRVAVEFGAGDGDSCSNTARLWRDEKWFGFLVEADSNRFRDLQANASSYDTECRQTLLSPSGPNSISKLLKDSKITDIDFMSIDIDGDDYFILRGLECKPRVICIEFNPTIPPHVEVKQAKVGESFGASLLAIVRLAGSIGYQFVGASRCNAFLVKATEARPFDSYETDLEVLFPANAFTYAISDYHGRVVLCGQPLPWQAKEPYVLPLDASTNIFPVTTSAQHLRTGFESLWGPAWWLSAVGLSKERLTRLLCEKRPLVCVDLTGSNPDATTWIGDTARSHNYVTLPVGPILGLVSKDHHA